VRVHHEEGVGGGVVFSWVVISGLVDEYLSFKLAFEFEVGVVGVGGVLIRPVIRGSLRQVWGTVEVDF
jgi:hypothetical protein